MVDFFGPNGALSKIKPGYVCRESQMEAAGIIYDNLLRDKHTLLEGPCGFGKTFAYLVPAIKRIVVEKGGKILVVTNGITLQSQLVAKDLPMLAELFDATGHELKYCAIKGKQNFLCKNKATTFSQGTFVANKEYHEIDTWITATHANPEALGELSELSFIPEMSLKSQIACVGQSDCLGKSCQFYGECYYQKQKSKAAKSDVIVTNYHMYFTDIKIGGSILPSPSAIIFDEAHEMSEIYRELNKTVVSDRAVTLIVAPIHRVLKEEPSLTQFFGVSPNGEPAFEVIIEKIKHRLAELISQVCAENNVLDSKFAGTYIINNMGSYPVAAVTSEMYVLSQYFSDIGEVLSDAAFDADPDLAEVISATIDLCVDAAEKVAEISSVLKQLGGGQSPDSAYYVEVSSLGERKICMKLAVSGKKIFIDVFRNNIPKIITSATLSSGGTFKFIREELGMTEMENVEEYIGQSPFDLKEQQLWYIPSDVVDGNSQDFVSKLNTHVPEIIEACGGGVLFLATSVSNMRKIYDIAQTYTRLSNKNIRVLMQGLAPREKLIQDFTSDSNSVLVATKSMFTGIDVPGESLRCVCIDKLPFVQASDPVALKLKQIDKSSFFRYEIPMMIITLKQAIGRGVRSVNDRCVVALLDRRITKAGGKSYAGTIGKSFSYPKVVTRDIGDVERFFGGRDA